MGKKEETVIISGTVVATDRKDSRVVTKRGNSLQVTFPSDSLWHRILKGWKHVKERVVWDENVQDYVIILSRPKKEDG